MKTIGLIGGMSWESTASYYSALNLGVARELGGLHSAKIILVSVDFAEIEQLQHQGRWQETADILATAAKSLSAAGADFFLICTNTMHKVAERVADAVEIPLLHIADATAELLLADGISKVGLLGTKFTMEQEFYKGRLSQQYGIEVLVPEKEQRDLVHEIIYSELCLGEIREDSRRQYLHIMQALNTRGTQAIVLGCTEIALLVQAEHTKIPLYDTTAIHADAAVRQALA